MARRVETVWAWPERVTTKRACGCAYISERDPIVRNGYEVGGSLSKACPKHSPAPVTQKDKA